MWRLKGVLMIGEERIGETPTYEIRGQTAEEAKAEATKAWIADRKPETFYSGIDPQQARGLHWELAND